MSISCFADWKLQRLKNCGGLTHEAQKKYLVETLELETARRYRLQLTMKCIRRNTV